MGWIDEVKGSSVADIASAFGLKATRGNAVKPCPACNAEQRGSTDRRGPVGLRPDGQGFKCWKCEITGDSPELASLAMFGKRLRDLDSGMQKKLRRQLADFGFCSASDETTSKSEGGWKVRRAAPRNALHVDSIPQGGGAFKWHDRIVEDAEEALWSEEGSAVLEYLKGRGLRSM